MVLFTGPDPGGDTSQSGVHDATAGGQQEERESRAVAQRIERWADARSP